MSKNVGDTVTFGGIECVVAYVAETEQSWGKYILCEKYNIEHYIPEAANKAWDPDNGSVTGELGTSVEIGYGKSNSDKAIQALGSNSNSIWYYVSQHRSTTGKDFSIPSFNELKQLHANMDLIGFVDLGETYDTSSEYNSNSIYTKIMSSGGAFEDYFNKNSTTYDKIRLIAYATDADLSTSTIQITCATTGADIRYTLDGTDPTKESAQYTAPFEAAQDVTIKARAFKDGFIASDIAELTIEAPLPKLSMPELKQESNLVYLTNEDAYPSDAILYYMQGENGGWVQHGTISDMESMQWIITMISEDLTPVKVQVRCEGYQDSDIASIEFENVAQPLPTPVLALGDDLGGYNEVLFANGSNYQDIYETAYFIFGKEYIDTLSAALGQDLSESFTPTEEGDYMHKVSDNWNEGMFENGSSFWIFVVGASPFPSTFKLKIRNEGYLDSDWGTCEYEEKLPTPVLSQAYSGTMDNSSGTPINAIYLDNASSYPNDAIVYGRAPNVEGSENWVEINRISTMQDNFLYIFADGIEIEVYVSCEGYQDSDVASITHNDVRPTLQTPTLSLSRSGSTVSGTVGNRVTGATYRYKVGSAPTSDSDGSAVSSSGTFSFTNSSAVTVYVKGFMDGYKDSSAVSASVSAYNPAPTNWVFTDDNKLGFGYGICYGNGKFVAVGSVNKGSYSYDGITWTAVEDTKLTTGTSVCYGNGKFVAVGDYGTGSYSYDGITWTAVDMKIGNDYDSRLSSVCYGGGKYVAVGRNGKGSYSADGINWTAIEDTKFGESYIRSICYGNGKFVAIGDDHKGAYSYDGITWTATDNIKLDGSDICYGDGKFVALGINFDSSYSYDGITWTATDIKAETHSANCICYENGVFVIILTERLSYSYDGITWTAVDNVVSGDDICYGNGRFVTLYGNSCYYCIF